MDQKELCEQAIKELKNKCDIERNYEIEITHLPEGIKIGDIVNVVDDSGELYLQSRLLKLETSVVDNTQTATLGEYLIKDSGVSQKVDDLAEKFSQLANGRKDIIKIEDEYYLSTSDETQSGGEWSNISDYEYGKYIWERSKITWTDGNTTHTDAHISGALNKANENAAESKDTANEAKETADNTLNDFSKFKVGEFDSIK